MSAFTTHNNNNNVPFGYPSYNLCHTHTYTKHHSADQDTNVDSDEEIHACWESFLQPLNPEHSYDTQYCDRMDLCNPSKENRHPDNRKLKNELCKNFIRNGSCRYGMKCQFAHGIDELRKNENQNSKYKTKKCLSFFKEGVCMYGMRCNFVHHLE